MELPAKEEANIIAPGPRFGLTTILLLLLTLLIGSGLGFLVNAFVFQYFPKTPPKTSFQPSPQISTESTLKESESPVAFDILKNPMVYEWRGSVAGTLIAKDEQSITIADDKGNKIIITVRSSSKDITGTTFYKNKPTRDPRTNFIALEDIPLGIKLQGDFFVFPHQRDKMIGSSFIVIEK